MNSPEKKKSNSDLLFETMSRYPSESKFLMFRNLSFGAAGICILMLSIIFPKGVHELPMQISLYASAVGVPLWVAIGSFYEFYIALGPKSYQHFRTKFAQGVFGAMSFLGGLSLLASLGGVLYFLSPKSCYLFGGSILFAIIIAIIFEVQLANWYFPRNAESNDEK